MKKSTHSPPRSEALGLLRVDPERRRMDQKSLETTQLALTHLDLHLVQNRSHFFLRDSKFFRNLKTDGAGDFSLSRLL